MDEKWTYTNSQRNRPNLIASCHNGLGGHRGLSSTYDQLEQFVYWTGMSRDIQERNELSTFKDACHQTSTAMMRRKRTRKEKGSLPYDGVMC